MAESCDMRSSIVIVATGLGIVVGATTRADVVVHLRSGGTIRADRTWTEGETVNVQMGNDVASFAPSAIESIEQLPKSGHPAKSAADAASNATTGSAPKAAQHADVHPSAPPAKPTPAPRKADLVPTVQGEDLATKLDRLDALSLQTHRQLTIARHEGEPEEKQKAIQEQIDEINRQRDDAIRKLGRAR